MIRPNHLLRNVFGIAFIAILLINQMGMPNPALAASVTPTPQTTPVVKPNQLHYGGTWDTMLPAPGKPVQNFAKQIASQAKAPAPKIRLRVSADPAIYIPGQPVQITWQMNGYGSQNGAANIIFTLPQGVTPSDTSLAAQVSTDGKLQIPVQNSTQNSLTLNVGAAAQFPLYIGVDLLVAGQVVDSRPVYLDQTGVSVQKFTGSTARVSSFGGRVQIQLPAAALSEDLLIQARNPSPNTTPALSLSGAPVEIVAVGKTTRHNVKKFSSPITIQVPYDTTKLFGGSEDDLMVYYYDEDQQDWYPMPTQVDKVNHMLTVQSDHLTVFDYQSASWQKYSLPTVDAFKVSGFTGAGTYDLNLWTPDGPGGFKPSLDLTYNSQVIDESTAFTQASYVGMGWSLDTGSITRNMHQTNTNTSDDTFSISMSGISGTLLPIDQDPVPYDQSGDYGTLYNTADQSFLRIEYFSALNKWQVWGKDGTIYTFGAVLSTSTSSGCVTNSSNLNLDWQWKLSAATDLNGNVINYTYDYDSKVASNGTQCLNELAVYPDTIIYPNNLYRIHFLYNSRSDYQKAWTDSNAIAFYSTQELSSIQIEQSDGLSWDWYSPTVLRQYQFAYSSGGTNQIYPNYTWSEGGYTLTLLGVQEKSGDGNTLLPAVQFTYGDGMHLTDVDNGQGGQVHMDYAPWNYLPARPNSGPSSSHS